MKIKIVNNSKHELPTYAVEGSAGMDLRANINEPTVLYPGERKLIPTGIHIALPKGYEAQVRPRSGLAYKYGITVLNAPGTIDSGFTGEIKVILINLSSQPFTVYDNDRIAQMIITKHETVEWNQVECLEDTVRGDGAFGHSGTK